MQGNDFSIVPIVLGKCQGSYMYIRVLNPSGIFFYVERVEESSGLLQAVCPHREGLITRTLKDEMLLASLCPLGGGTL